MQDHVLFIEGHHVPCLVVGNHEFIAVPTLRQLQRLAPDPRRSETASARANDTDLAQVHELRQAVQRTFVGAKKTNVSSFTRYILSLHEGDAGGTLPIMLWSVRTIHCEAYGDGVPFSMATIPYDCPLVAVDGETQLASRFEAAQTERALLDKPVPVLVMHGRDAAWAAQVFHDVNAHGIKPNPGVALSRDSRDPVTRLTREVEARVPFFTGRVNDTARQLHRDDRNVMTLSGLRTAVSCCVRGIKVLNGSTNGQADLRPEQMGAIREVVVSWFGAVTSSLSEVLENRQRYLAHGPAAFAAIGALGHQLIGIADPAERSRRQQELVEVLNSINWERSAAWESVAGRMHNGSLALDGARQAAHKAWKAITDPTYPAYSKIRRPSLTAV